MSRSQIRFTFTASETAVVLDALLYIHFTENVTRRTTNVQLHSLPPTAAAAVHHNARVYF